MEDNNNIQLKQEKKRVYNNTYYDKHKSDILEKIKVKVPCGICDKLISKSNYSRHVNKCREKHLCDLELYGEYGEYIDEIDKKNLDENKKQIIFNYDIILTEL
jgi:hypothetical protein